MLNLNFNLFNFVGGSYPGALSAWFRSKYPYLTIGALASSAVVKAIEAFPEFDRQVYLSLKKSSLICAESVQNLTSLVQNMLKENPEIIKKQFSAEMLSNEEFLFFFADIFVEVREKKNYYLYFPPQNVL